MDKAVLDRFSADLDGLSPREDRLGVAISGGPDSLALLILAAAARPGLVEAATVDHALRDTSRAEAETVATICANLGVPHAILTVEWPERPETAIQERAREARYRLLDAWLADRGLCALATAHHADDQAETLLMRLNRGSGVRGLAGIRPVARIPDGDHPLLRPLLGWRRAELAQVCADAGVHPATDPSNADDRYERARIRGAIADAAWLDSTALARSAAHLAAADEALEWMVQSLALGRVTDDTDALRVDPRGLPAELRRRLLLHAFARFGASEPRGADLTRAIGALERSGTVTLSGLRIAGGSEWRVTREAPRTRP